jgi:LysR family transcriptional regulator, hydrogen peroxide-inducible genes activator
MTLTQLEYLIAVDTYRHFNTAAEACFITQPTLSMQLQKLEEELGVKIFDRSRVPVVPTDIGKKIIEQARIAVRESKAIKEVIAQQKDVMQGELRIGIIPTLAPYLLPLFLQEFSQAYPLVKIRITEEITGQIIEDIRTNKLDAGILVTPLQDNSMKEEPLFYEELFAYVSDKNALYKKRYILSKDINPDELYLLEEGHCFRSQIMNLCELKHSSSISNIEYEAGSIETLMRLIEKTNGITIIPELATLDLNKKQQLKLRTLKDPNPAREVSLVTHRDYVKRKLIQALRKQIVSVIPPHMLKPRNKQVVEFV